jgi:hypothetical protein
MSAVIALDDDTERRPAIKSMQSAQPVPELRFPMFYIIAPLDTDAIGLAMPVIRRIETASAGIFVAWVKKIMHVEGKLLLVPHSYEHISISGKFKAVNALAKSGIDMSKYLFDGHEAAARALSAMKTAKRAESEVGNGK